MGILTMIFPDSGQLPSQIFPLKLVLLSYSLEIGELYLIREKSIAMFYFLEDVAELVTAESPT